MARGEIRQQQVKQPEAKPIYNIDTYKAKIVSLVDSVIAEVEAEKVRYKYKDGLASELETLLKLKTKILEV